MRKPKVLLPKGWSDYSKDNPDGPPTFLRDLSEVPGPLQISFEEYKGGEIPNPKVEDLTEMAIDLGKEQKMGELIESNNGDCDFGKYGTAIFRSRENPRIQVWYLSNGKDFVLATHISPEEPESQEIIEAQEIVMKIVLSEKPWWKIW